jgi:hypothetical protein
MDRYELPEGVLVSTVLVDSKVKFNWDHDRTAEARNSHFSQTMPKLNLNGSFQFSPPSTRKIDLTR